MKQPLKGPHHFTGRHARRRRQRGLLVPRDGPAVRQEHAQLRDDVPLPHLLRRRGGQPGQRRHLPRVQRGAGRRPRRRRHPPDGPARRLLRLARVLDGPPDRQPAPLRAAAPGSDLAAVAGLLGPGGPRGRADGVRRDRHAAASPTPTTSPPSTASSASRARARSRRSRSRRRSPRTSASAQDGNRLVLDGERSGRWYFSEPTGRPSNDGRVGVWHHIAYDAGDGEETQRARDEANEGLRPWTKIFDHYFFDSCYSMSPGGRMEICTSGAWISARREARRPRRPPLSLASSGAASRQARSPS